MTEWGARHVRGGRSVWLGNNLARRGIGCHHGSDWIELGWAQILLLYVQRNDTRYISSSGTLSRCPREGQFRNPCPGWPWRALTGCPQKPPLANRLQHDQRKEAALRPSGRGKKNCLDPCSMPVPGRNLQFPPRKSRYLALHAALLSSALRGLGCLHASRAPSPRPPR